MKPRVVLLLLIGAALLAYQPAWNGGFLWDDEGHVTRESLRGADGLVRIWFSPGATQQVLSGSPFRLLALSSAVGERPARLSHRQHPLARGVGLSAVRAAAASRGAGRAAGGIRLCVASGPCRVGRVDLRVEERPFRCVLSRRSTGVSPLPRQPQQEELRVRAGVVHARGLEQDRHGDVPGGDGGHSLVAGRHAARARKMSRRSPHLPRSA